MLNALIVDAERRLEASLGPVHRRVCRALGIPQGKPPVRRRFTEADRERLLEGVRRASAAVGRLRRAVEENERILYERRN